MKHKEEFISIAGAGLVWPAAALCETLVRQKRDPANPDIPNVHEVNSSTAVCLLLVLVFESYLSRVRHFDLTSASAQKKSAWSYFSSLKGCKRLGARVAEVMLIRNSIAHNHVYTYEQVWEDFQSVHVRNFRIDTSWQTDSKFKQVVLLKRRGVPRTRILQLRTVPSLIGREEVVAVFRTIEVALSALCRHKYLDLSVRHVSVPFKGVHDSHRRMKNFWEICQEIENSLQA